MKGEVKKSITKSFNSHRIKYEQQKIGMAQTDAISKEIQFSSNQTDILPK